LQQQLGRQRLSCGAGECVWGAGVARPLLAQQGGRGRRGGGGQCAAAAAAAAFAWRV